VNLQDYIETNKKNPDFGFDTHNTEPFKFEKVQVSLSKIMKGQSENFAACVAEIQKLRELYNKILRQKYFKVPLNIRKLPECSELFDSFFAQEEVG